tara:strand:+ start:12196 stop:12555 length:360 start_codon:yes stop_codon:yes gene_type:complete
MSVEIFKLQEIELPDGITLVFSDFSTYDPSTQYSLELSSKYISEDLFQASFDEGRLVIDLGWYGDVETNIGEYKIQIIYGSDWDYPVTTIFAKSQGEARDTLIRVLAHVASGDMFEDEE